jgi:cytochrome P450
MSIQLTQIQHAPKIQHAPNLLGGISFVPFLTRFLADSAGCVSQLADQYGNDTAVAVATPFNLSQRKYVVGIGARQNQMVLGHKTAFRTTGYMFNGPPGSAMSRIRNGLLHSRGKEQSGIRSMLQPIFSNKSIEKPFGQFIRITREQTDTWQPGTQIELWQEMCLLTRRLSGRILLANESDESLDDLSDKIQRVVDRTFNGPGWHANQPRRSRRGQPLCHSPESRRLSRPPEIPS